MFYGLIQQTHLSYQSAHRIQTSNEGEELYNQKTSCVTEETAIYTAGSNLRWIMGYQPIGRSYSVSLAKLLTGGSLMPVKFTLLWGDSWWDRNNAKTIITSKNKSEHSLMLFL